MEKIVNSTTDYVSALIVERWAELLVLAVMLALWRWWMGYKLRDRIAALEVAKAQPAESQARDLPQASLSISQTASPTINITNIVSGNPKRAKLTGRFHIGSMFYPNLLQETMHPTFLVPEILIEQEDGTREVLNIDGYKVVDDLGLVVQNDIEISDGFMFQLGRPDEPARIDISVREGDPPTEDRGDD